MRKRRTSICVVEFVATVDMKSTAKIVHKRGSRAIRALCVCAFSSEAVNPHPDPKRRPVVVLCS